MIRIDKNLVKDNMICNINDILAVTTLKIDAFSQEQ